MRWTSLPLLLPLPLILPPTLLLAGAPNLLLTDAVTVVVTAAVTVVAMVILVLTGVLGVVLTVLRPPRPENLRSMLVPCIRNSSLPQHQPWPHQHKYATRNGP